MRILYVRTSTIQQNTERQRIKEKDYDLVVEDKVSGAIPFNERPGGNQILGFLEKGEISELSVWSIDRLGRDVRDIINTIHQFSKNKVCINFISQGLQTLNENGDENPISKLIINILGVISEMERNQIRERQLERIAIAKAKGVYQGRKRNTKEDTLKFLSKPKNKKASELLKKGYKSVEVAKIVGLHPNTISKIKGKLMIE